MELWHIGRKLRDGGGQGRIGNWDLKWGNFEAVKWSCGHAPSPYEEISYSSRNAGTESEGRRKGLKNNWAMSCTYTNSPQLM